ncbi:FAD-dependent oxidoreductase [Cytobacillus purgationiresistens]|uniref:Glycine/D-amino acid oxidase-like deaminating enzyme/nitrite reductase/ring-hydroxylating ferredoxin subunit n=1 Tax=Cytobacillus purgationiresistens TaxID=863449 RepID=A0ABU0AJP3_9BACI|nr:FAD-dependent oxidoreductase [Cytobacillus purgationiresistens]MDQ0271495.1 glycine/D-amino acid oxidase-like deaminating enzyme/nitrite reductase/ring-hydroxylating ferredoxin subunit [Cytobacillus purgationiresistens]
MTASNYSMPQYPESYWQDEKVNGFEKLNSDVKTDIVIVGAGITGITSANLLIKEGFKVIIIETGKVMNGTTGHTTAKITAQHGLIYDELITNLGIEKAKQYYDAQEDAIKFIQTTANSIDCDFSQEDSFIYSTSDEYSEKLTNEFDAYQRLKINGSLVDSIPFNIPTTGVLAMHNQAQFHPVKYLKGLLDEFVNNGGTVYENTTAIDVEEGTEPVVITKDGNRITCKFVISASHYPFVDMKAFYFARLLPERSYVLGVKTTSEYPGGMYYSADQPKRSLRFTPYNGEKLILVSGEGHKTGKGIDTLKHYRALEEFASETLGITDYPYRWSAQDLTTLDDVPYIGPITSKQNNIFVATGFRKWGMTNGTAAALLLKDLITEKSNPYQQLFTPSRFAPNPSIKNFISYNTDVAGQLIKGKLEYVPMHAEDLQNDEGAVVKVNGKRAGAYRDKEGKLHIVDTTCTHLGCETEWNHGDRTWDCPCHGSRFSYNGKVLEGPAEKPLDKIE